MFHVNMQMRPDMHCCHIVDERCELPHVNVEILHHHVILLE